MRRAVAICAHAQNRAEGRAARSPRSLASSVACGLSYALRLVLFGLVVAIAQPPGAQAQDESLLDQPAQPPSRSQPLLLQADELITNNNDNTVVARGNVEIYYNGYTLLADRVIYDQTTKILTAEGNVRINEPNGAVVNAERIQLTDDFRDGFVEGLRVVTPDNVRIAAERAERIDGETSVFTRAVYTPCKVCAENPNKVPAWRIKARKIIHRRSEGNIYYEDATLEIFGVPVITLPEFNHPDPSVKRRSGFLRPDAGQNDELGVYVETPYHWVIAPNKDLTLTPRVMTREGLLAQAEWRHRVETGAYKISLAGIYDEDYDRFGDGSQIVNEFRGSVITEGRFKLGSWWHFGWDATLESDDTFRRFYKLDDEKLTERVSRVYVEGINDRNYLAVNLYSFRDLQADANPFQAESEALPAIDYNYVFASPVLGGELSFDAHALSLVREQGTDTSKVIAEAQWRRQFIDRVGQVFTPFFRGRADIYRSENFAPPPGLVPADGTETRGVVTAGLQYSFPFVRHGAFASHVVEPIAQIITRGGSVNQNAVANEDSQSDVFDDTLLFEADKFSGYDRIETGTRANVGLRYTAQMHDGGYLRTVVGQSYSLSGANPFALGSGLGTDDSDFVAGVYYAPNSMLTLLAQGRFDQDDLTLQRHDIGAEIDYGPIQFNGNYSFRRSTPFQPALVTEQELLFDSTLQVAENWALLGGLRYDLENNRTLKNSIGLRYSDDCFVLSVVYSENAFDEQDLDRDQTILVRFELLQLGASGFATDAIGDLQARSDQEGAS